MLSEISLSEIGMGISTEIIIKAHKAGCKIVEVPITILYAGDTSTHNPVSHGSSVVFSTLKYAAIERPLTSYGIPGLFFLLLGLVFGFWSLQIYLEQGQLITNLAIIGGGGILLGTVLLITATILHSIVSVVREK